MHIQGLYNFRIHTYCIFADYMNTNYLMCTEYYLFIVIDHLIILYYLFSNLLCKARVTV